MKKIKKRDLIINFTMVLFSIIIMFFNNNMVLSLEQRLIISFVYFAIYIVNSIIKVKGIKNIFFSIEIIYSIVFFAYMSLGALIFVLDGYSPRFYYFKYNLNSMNKTLAIYLNIYCIFNAICFFTNSIREYNMKANLEKIENKTLELNNEFTIFDFIALFATLYCLIRLLSKGISFFSLTTLERRAVLNSGISHYINLYVIVYSLFLATTHIFKKFNKNVVYKFRILNILVYWLIFLTCERSVFVAFLIGFFMIFAVTIKKIRFYHIFIIVVITISFLFSAALRENIKLSSHKLGDVIYGSTTEYYCTFTISNYYVQNKQDLLYGKTYVVDSISKLFPSFLLKNKPKDLSQKFKEENNLNVGFAFNPVAEGIMNFGEVGAVIVVPLITFMIITIAKIFAKKNVLYYIITACYSLYYCRGAFSNYFFDIVFCYCLIFVFYKFTIGRGKKHEKNRIGNIS